MKIIIKRGAGLAQAASFPSSLAEPCEVFGILHPEQTTVSDSTISPPSDYT